MTAASAFGDADFDRQAQDRIAKVREVEKFPQTRILLVRLGTSWPIRIVLSSLVGTVSAFVCAHLKHRTRVMHDSAAWFDGEYLAYFSAVAAESRVPHDRFMQAASKMRASNLAAIRSCDESIKALRALNPHSKIAAALEDFTVEAQRLEIVVEKYMDIGQTANNSKAQMAKVHMLHVELNRQLAGYYEDHNDSFDPALGAAAEAALQRMMDRK